MLKIDFYFPKVHEMGVALVISEQGDSPRMDFLRLRDQLRKKHENADIIAVWDSMMQRERAVVLKAADLPISRSVDGLHRFTREEICAIRDAIKRMARFANSLVDRCQHQPHPSRDLAKQAHRALDNGDMKTVKHYLTLIEEMA